MHTGGPTLAMHPRPMAIYRYYYCSCSWCFSHAHHTEHGITENTSDLKKSDTSPSSTLMQSSDRSVLMAEWSTAPTDA